MTKRRKSIGTMFAEGRPVDAAMRAAAREALRQHELAGLPVVVWRNGEIVHARAGKARMLEKTIS